MQKSINIFKKVKNVILHNEILCIVFLFALFIITMPNNTFARLVGVINKNAGLEIANLVIEINSQKMNKDLARGKDIEQYFSISNYDTSGNITELAYDYYIFIINKEGNSIPNAKLYKYEVLQSNNLITQDNPNTYVEVNKEIDGNYKDGFYVGELFLDKNVQDFKLKVTDIQEDAIQIKAVAIQKEPTN